MRRHDTVGQQPRLRPLDRFFEDPFEGRKVLRLLEDRHPRVGAVENMINQSAVGCSFRSSHSLTLSKRSFPVKVSAANTSSLQEKRFLTPFPDNDTR